MTDFKTKAILEVDDKATRDLKKINKAFNDLNKTTRKVSGRTLFRGVGRGLIQSARRFGTELRRVGGTALRGVGRGLVTSARAAGRIFRRTVSGVFRTGSRVLAAGFKGAVVGFTAAIIGAVATIKNAANRLDDLAKQSRTTGFSPEDLKLVKTFLQFNSSSEEGAIDSSLLAFSKRLSQLRADPKRKQNFTRLGDSDAANATRAALIASKDTGEALSLLRDFVRSIQGTKDEGRTNAIVDEAFGRQGLEAVKPFLVATAEAIAKQNAQTQRNQFIPSTADLTAAENFNDSLSEMANVLKGFGDSFSTKIFENFTRSIRDMSASFAENRESITTEVADVFNKIVTSVTGFLTALANGEYNSQIAEATQAVKDFGSAIASIAQSVATVVKAVAPVVKEGKNSGGKTFTEFLNDNSFLGKKNPKSISEESASRNPAGTFAELLGPTGEVARSAQGMSQAHEMVSQSIAQSGQNASGSIDTMAIQLQAAANAASNFANRVSNLDIRAPTVANGATARPNGSITRSRSGSDRPAISRGTSAI